MCVICVCDMVCVVWYVCMYVHVCVHVWCMCGMCMYMCACVM